MFLDMPIKPVSGHQKKYEHAHYRDMQAMPFAVAPSRPPQPLEYMVARLHAAMIDSKQT